MEEGRACCFVGTTLDGAKAEFEPALQKYIDGNIQQYQNQTLQYKISDDGVAAVVYATTDNIAPVSINGKVLVYSKLDISL